MPVEITRRRRKGAQGGDVRALRRAVQAVLAAEAATTRDVAVLLTDDHEIHELNRNWRSADKPTDVLAFAWDETEGAPGEGGPLGDVIISVERARRQASSRGVTLESELELLMVHGTLHLLGYDHAAPDEARAMRAQTRAIRRRLARADAPPTLRRRGSD